MTPGSGEELSEMQIHRRFRIAPSLARLIRKERGINEQIAEGHFPPHPERGQYVSISRETCFLVLRETREGVESESRTEIPRAQAEGLMDICASKIAYGRTILQVQGARELSVDYFLKPGAFDIVTLTFDGPGQAAAFRAPMWFGPEVTQNAAYDKRVIALEGLPKADYVPLSDAALNALLNVFEHARPASEEAREVPAHDTQPAARPEPVHQLPVASPMEMAAPEQPVYAPAAQFEDSQPDEAREPETAVAEAETGPDAAPEARIESVIAGLSNVLVPEPPSPFPEPRPSAVRSGWEIRRARPAIR